MQSSCAVYRFRHLADDSVGGLRDWAMQAGQQFERHYDQLCFAALNSGVSTAYGKTYDGLSLFNAAHVDKGARYQIAQDNALTLALSVDNFETAKITAGAFKDGQGNNTGFSYNTLVVSDSLERIGSQIALNTNVYDTANRELNPYAGTKLVVAPGGYLDSTAWYLTAGDMLVKPIILQKRQKPMLKVWEDNHAGVIWFKWTARYNVGYADWRTVVQGNS